ncbi:uncharacterized protein [Battus philenor]|uniref:uncharacterized protein n=1 Tax=Battus philenor TaxID=42288 RepID=UPI0035CF2322
MKIFAVIAILATSVAAKGSGPYLPSGWRPEGPAFYLPSEVEKPKENQFKDVVFQETEASGSDSLREYGPPKVETIFLEPSKQGLPDIVTEQAFAVIEAKVEKKEESAVTEVEATVEDSEANLSQQSLVQEVVPVTEVLAYSEGTTSLVEVEVNTEPVDLQQTVEATTQSVADGISSVIEVTEKVTEQEVNEISGTQQTLVQDKIENAQEENVNANSDILSVYQEKEVQEVQTVEAEVQKVETEVKRVEAEVQKIETKVETFETEVKAVEQIVQNIPELLINIDNEIKQQQVENVQELSLAKLPLQTFGSLEQAPEGFLEYGPPGFKEYGPPKEDLNATPEIVLPAVQTVENNEARKRRFSPKFRATRKANNH